MGEASIPADGAATSTRWRLRRTDAGLRLGAVRTLSSETFTWADLLRAPLGTVRVYTVYFPSRFDLPVDEAATESLRKFGPRVGASTSVNFWDPTDPNFSAALALFGLRQPPALVLAGGQLTQSAARDGQATSFPGLYCISFADEQVLSDRARTATAVNIAHEILMRDDSDELAGYIRKRKVAALLALIGRGAGAVRDELLALHPKFGLPGGISLELG